MEEQKQEKKEEKTDDLLNEKIKADNKNNNDSKLNSTKLGDIMNKEYLLAILYYLFNALFLKISSGKINPLR